MMLKSINEGKEWVSREAEGKLDLDEKGRRRNSFGRWRVYFGQTNVLKHVAQSYFEIYFHFCFFFKKLL